MLNTRNIFTGGRMDLDSDVRIIPNTLFRRAENIRVVNSEGSDVGAIEKSLSNTQKSYLNLGGNAETIGTLADEFEDKIYWAVVSDQGSYVLEYDMQNDTAVKVLEDERIGIANQLRFDKTKLLQMVLIVDSDNGNRLLSFTDDNTQPKLINVERAKTYGLNGFTESMILLIKPPPLHSPTLTLGSTGSQENNMSEKFLTFFTRFRYLDGEYSALSPSTRWAFRPSVFNFDYSTGTNESMVNAFNQATIGFNTGSDQVTDIEVVFKESGSNTLYIVDTYNKADKAWTDDSTESIVFENNKIRQVLPEDELFRLYDNVPLLAKTIAVINNRLVFGNYTENYNLIDSVQSTVRPNFTTALITSPIVDDTPTESLKSIRDYEVFMAYVDGQGRMTTPLDSEQNTVYIPNSNCVTKNEIRVTIPHNPPSFAKYFRFFIKINQGDYDTVIPTQFYQDGVFVWVKLEGSDNDKIKEGDFLYVKADSQGVLNAPIQTKVLEITSQERNFLEEDTETELRQLPGVYFRIRPTGFRINEDDFVNYNFEAYDDSSNKYDNPIRNGSNAIEQASYYGISGLNDLASGGTYTGNTDIRYLVQIFTTGATDTFRWSNDDGANWNDNGGLGFDLTGLAQPLENGVEITFNAITGHDATDEWIVSAKSDSDDNFGGSESSKAYAFFKSLDANTNINAEDVIEGGARISLTYDEYGDGTEFISKTYISSRRYDNLEEWWHRDNIQDDFGVDASRVWFRRGTVGNTGSANFFTQSEDGDMVLIILSQFTQNNDLDDRVNIRSSINIFQSEQNIILETKPIDENSEIAYEIGQTYAITNNFHIGNSGTDIDQTAVVPAQITLPAFNCFAWGNGYESYKIKDEFNARSFKLDTRPSAPIDDYRENKRIASLTYGAVYEQTTNYNALNEFNLSQGNFLDLDDRYGKIQRIVSWNTDLDVYQDDKVHKVYYDKAVIYNRDGSTNLSTTDDILSGVIAYAGEYGISTNGEGLAVFGNYTYWPDWKRGLVLRKGRSGIEVISDNGMRDWFRDTFRDGDNIKTIGSYDSYFGQYVLTVNGHTITFDEKVLGWTSFHSFIPSGMARLNNRFYTMKNGQIWLHNSGDNYNNFYGEQFSSKITTIFNEEVMYDKIFKVLALESLLPWKATIETNYTNATIRNEEFTQKESRWFGYIRQNERTDDLRGVSEGIGNLTAVNALTMDFNQVNERINIGDDLYQVNGDLPELIGTITDKTKTSLTVDAITTTPVTDSFCFARKDSRIEGSEIRGFYSEVTLEDFTTKQNELFAVTCKSVMSFVAN